MTQDPLEVECPVCLASEGSPCMSASQESMLPHEAREKRAAGRATSRAGRERRERRDAKSARRKSKKPKAPAGSVACPVCGAPPRRTCVTTQMKPRKAHPDRQRAADAYRAQQLAPRKRTGNGGSRLTYTSAPSREIRKKQAAARKPQPVVIRHVDGSTDVRDPNFTQPRKRRSKGGAPRAAMASVARDRAAKRTPAALRDEQARLKREAAERRRKVVPTGGAESDAARVGRG